MVHLYDKGSMAYTACWRLPQGLETTSKRSKVTCPNCLHPLDSARDRPRDAEGQPVTVGHLVLMPNGRSAMVDAIIVVPTPSVVVVYRGEQVTIPAGEVVLMPGSVL